MRGYHYSIEYLWKSWQGKETSNKWWIYGLRDGRGRREAPSPRGLSRITWPIRSCDLNWFTLQRASAQGSQITRTDF
jgi:hypothetical protein